MVKNIFRILLIIGLFFSVLINIFAFEAKISLNKNTSDINDYIKLRIQITSNNGGEIRITNIKGLEKFEVISQSQSQTSSTSMIVNNGKTESKINMSNNLDLTLRAKAKGKYIIGPATLKKGNEEIKTNTIEIEISGDKLFINNNNLNILKNTSINTISNNSTKKIENTNNKKGIEEKINKYDNVKKADFYNSKELYLLIIVAILTGMGLYFFIKFNPGVEKEKHKEKHKDKDKDLDFDIKKIDLSFPEVKDENFIKDISLILKQKIAKKYYINNIGTKTFDEILGLIGKEVDPKISKLIYLVNKAKYSNIIGDNGKILDLIKEI